MMARVDGDEDARIRDGFERVLARLPTSEEIKHVQRLREEALANYRAKPAEAAALIANAENPPPAEIDAVELAAWTSVARALLNLSEPMTRN